MTVVGVLCATSVCALATGSVIGPYVDNETPHRCIVVSALERAQSLPVFYGVSQYETGFYCKAGGVKLQEWYPYRHGRDVLGQPPCGAPGFITQWLFAWPNSPPPTRRQRRRLLARVRLCHPAYIVRY